MLQIKKSCEDCSLASGLNQTMEGQFSQWNLTTAEKAVCRSLLAGKSLRQISEDRDTNVTTVRQQALAIYNKSGLKGRHSLAAYFLKKIFEYTPEN